MKLIIQLPCYDEAASLPATLAALPRTVAGFDVVETLVVDDGSRDGTADVARRHGATHVVSHPRNLGLAAAWMTGIRTALALGADVIVGTDGDNQYCGADIPGLVAPVRDGHADFAMGVRPLDDRQRFPPWKAALTRLGTVVARALSGVPVRDAPSGFRAFSRAAAERLRVTGTFSYTMETLVLAGSLGWRLASVPVRVNPVARRSRLMKSVPQYIRKSVSALLRGVALHRPWRMAVLVGTAASVTGFGAGLACAAVAPASTGPVAALASACVALIGFGKTLRVRALAARLPVAVAIGTSGIARVGPDADRGDDLAGRGRDEEEPLPDVGPVAGIGMPLAAGAGDQSAGR